MLGPPDSMEGQGEAECEGRLLRATPAGAKGGQGEDVCMCVSVCAGLGCTLDWGSGAV